MSDIQTSKPAKGDTFVKMETTHGTVTIRFFPKDAPRTVENFVTHAKNGYYDGIIFHRVIKDFMIQGGDPTGTGSGGVSIYGEKFENESSPRLSHIVGALSMANAGRDTNGSQFFIVQGKDAKYLNGDYSIFGQVAEGMDVVDTIAKIPVDRNDRPKTEVKIVKMTVGTFE